MTTEERVKKFDKWREDMHQSHLESAKELGLTWDEYVKRWDDAMEEIQNS